MEIGQNGHQTKLPSKPLQEPAAPRKVLILCNLPTKGWRRLANMAQNKGVFNLQEASAVATAVSAFVTPPATTSEETTDSAEETSD